jgi:hypothetical protein
MTYVKKLDATTAINTDAIANLSSIVKDNMTQSHDKLQQVTRDILQLNVTIHGQGVMCMVIWQLEFALLHLALQLDELFGAIQCAIQGNLLIKFVNPPTLQNILRN